MYDISKGCDNCYSMVSKQTKTMTESLRQRIVDSELPLLTLEQETGVKRQSIMRFLRGERSLRLDTADKLAAYFDLQLVKRRGK